MGYYVRYIFDCGCRRDWSDGTSRTPTKIVRLSEPCNSCLHEADRKHAELKRLYGKAVKLIGVPKAKGR